MRILKISLALLKRCSILIVEEILEEGEGIMKVLVTDFFDVWGNSKDGWEVNNQCHDVYNTRFKLDSRKSCLKFLKSIDYLKKSVREASIYWEDMENGYILYQSKDFMPICSVEYGEIVDKYY